MCTQEGSKCERVSGRGKARERKRERERGKERKVKVSKMQTPHIERCDPRKGLVRLVRQ